MLVAVQCLLHQANKFRVGIWLKFSGSEILFLIHIVHGKGLQPFPAFTQLPGADGADQAGIQTAGKECADWDIRHHLPQDRILHQIADVFGGFREAFPMLPIQQLPITTDTQFSMLEISAAARLQFLHTVKDAAARSPSRSKQDQLRSALWVQLCLDCWVAQDGFHFGCKDQAAIVAHIKERLHTDAVTGKEQTLPFFFEDTEGKDSIEFSHAPIAPLGVCVQNHFRIRVTFKEMPCPLQLRAHFLCIIQLTIVYQNVMLPIQG